MKHMIWIFPLLFIVFTVQRFNINNQPPNESHIWPMPSEWQQLSERVEGRLIKVESPLFNPQADSVAIDHLLQELQNPFVIQEYPWGAQSTGWLNAWSTQPSAYAVAASKTRDIIEAVKFARKHQLKLVVKGAGHDYLGRSNAAHSLLVWTHPMRQVTMQEAFIPAGAPANQGAIPAVTIEAGARWIEVYQEVTTKHNRYVQGGGCPTVGAVGGFLQGGGFGSFSKKYGIAAASLLEAEVVLANGEVVIANEYQNSDLFWALKGGGGGTFGIVSAATLATHELPKEFGLLRGNITANTDEAFQALLEYFIHFYREKLNNEHWGEQVTVKPNNTLDLWLVFQGLNREEVEAIWEPFQRWAAEQSGHYAIHLNFTLIPANKLWNYDYLAKNLPDLIKPYPSKEGTMFYWASNQREVLAYWYTYQSRWLPAALFEKEASQQFAKTLFLASRQWEFSLHFNKGLAGASPEAILRSKKTSMNPIVLDAAALVICGALAQHVFPGIAGHEPDIPKGLEAIQRIHSAMEIITQATPHSGAYSNEADYFQHHWQDAFWGEHYPKLLEIKQKYDPDGFFKCHHGVGSEISLHDEKKI